ncbi:MAG: serine/threonine-protein kinase [Kofleriaceae bacterium]
MAADPVDDDPTPFQVVVPARDELTREVAMAQLKRRLFDRDVAVKIGRYQLLEVVGQGGMGVVWGAWDPELDRKVAVKLVHASVPAARDRMLLEGQALAKLSHPNVVPIYDVGTLGDQVYLVMELVRGANLRVYASEPRHVRDLIAVYRDAGEGLAAAHAAGLVHRDFKPENVIRGDIDGRVRVVDFGLAQSSEDDGQIAGTPRYMAPEHAAGAPATAASDQFSFCIALREAIAGSAGSKTEVALPRWVELIVARGTRPDPIQRFPSMRALLHALARDPRRVWQVRAAVGLAAVAVAAAFVIGSSRGGAEHALCAGAEGELDAVFGARVRAAIASNLAPLGEVKIVRDLAAYRGTWVAAHRAACIAHGRGELPITFYERRLGCLARAKASLGAVGELLAAVPRDRLDNALVAAHSLPDVAHCGDQDAAQITPPPAAMAAQVAIVTNEIERARVLAVAVEPGAEQVARATVREAEATRYPPILARALLVQGRAEIAIEDPGAPATLARAVRIGIEAGDDLTAIEAFARQVWVATGADVEVDGRSLIEPLAIRIAPRGAFERALLYHNLASARIARGDRPGARTLLLEARRQVSGDPADTDVELVCIAQTQALIATTAREREQQLGSVAATLERVLGAAHANTLEARLIHGLGTLHGTTARARVAAACDGYRRHKPHLAAARAWCGFELAWLADEVDDVTTATSAMQLAVADPKSDRYYATIGAAYLALVTGTDPSRTIAELRTFAARVAVSPQYWERVYAADAYIAAARGAERRNLPALGSWSAALSILEAINLPIYDRRLARVRAAVARELVHTQPDEAHRLSKLARAWYVAAGGYDDLIAALPQ